MTMEKMLVDRQQRSQNPSDHPCPISDGVLLSLPKFTSMTLQMQAGLYPSILYNLSVDTSPGVIPFSPFEASRTWAI